MKYYVDVDDPWTLRGPNNFQCQLCEPEDRSWLRDGRDVVKRLNKLDAVLRELVHTLTKAQDYSGTRIGYVIDQAETLL